MDDFYAARSRTIPPLAWPNIAPPFSFGGGLALLVAGYVIATYGIQYMLYLALGGLVVGAFLMLGLAETAPRKVKRNA